jgi:transposase
MMGKQEAQVPLFVPGFDLGSRVRADHPLRRVEAAVDFSFVRPLVAPLYGYNGNVSVDPEVVLKLMFLLFYYNVPSERELMRTLSVRLDWLWFLGYGLEDAVPDHSVLSKARRRWGHGVFREFFTHTIDQCMTAGLVDGAKVHMDGSLVSADASNDSVVRGSPERIAALRRLFDREAEKLDEPEAPASSPEEKPEEGPPGYEPKNDGLMSTTDPDARVVRKGRMAPDLCYKNHRVVDDAFGVITATETTPGDVKENGEMLRLLAEHERNTGAHVETAVADSQYGTVENFRTCAELGIRPHMADLSQTQRGTGRREGIFPESAFTYDPATDTYRCPAGQTLRRRRHKEARRAYEYAAGRKVCAACELRAQCTRSAGGRNVKRHEDHALIEAARAEARSRAAKRDRRRRKHLMEGSFADAATHHGFKRSRWRRLWRQQIQDYLIAGIQNLRVWLRHGPERTRGVTPKPVGPLWPMSWAFLALALAVWAHRHAPGSRRMHW